MIAEPPFRSSETDVPGFPIILYPLVCDPFPKATVTASLVLLMNSMPTLWGWFDSTDETRRSMQAVKNTIEAKKYNKAIKDSFPLFSNMSPPPFSLTP